MQAVMETAFDAAYLSSVITIGILMIRGSRGNRQYLLFGVMAVVLGAGDAFASTFCAALERNRLDIAKSLMYASVNSAAAVSEFGATQGLLTFEQIEEKLKNAPDYTCKIIK